MARSSPAAGGSNGAAAMAARLPPSRRAEPAFRGKAEGEVQLSGVDSFLYVPGVLCFFILFLVGLGVFLLAGRGRCEG